MDCIGGGGNRSGTADNTVVGPVLIIIVVIGYSNAGRVIHYQWGGAGHRHIDESSAGNLAVTCCNGAIILQDHGAGIGCIVSGII